MADELPKPLEDRYDDPEEVGGDHAEVTGVWRVLVYGLALAVLGLAAAAGLFYLFG